MGVCLISPQCTEREEERFLSGYVKYCQSQDMNCWDPFGPQVVIKPNTNSGLEKNLRDISVLF